MNKQELIKKVKALEGYNSASSRDYEVGHDECMDKVVLLIEQLDEPQKVKVPQFVAEWIELCKEKADLSSCLNGYYEIGDGTIVRPRGFSEEFYDWLSDYDHMHDLARAYLDGYEVEEEPKWVVKYKPGNLENNWYFIGFCGVDRTLQPNCANRIDCDTVIKFKDRSKAEAVATLIDGTVEKV